MLNNDCVSCNRITGNSIGRRMTDMYITHIHIRILQKTLKSCRIPKLTIRCQKGTSMTSL